MINVRLRGFTCFAICVMACLVLLLCLAGTATAAPSGYQYSISHSILGSPDGTQASQVMKLIVYNTTGTTGGSSLYVGSSCRADFNDLYFYDGSDAIAYPHWINWDESGANYVTVYYNITTGVQSGGTNIIVYYGYPAALNHENPYGVFKIYEPFSGATVNTSIWTDASAGTATVSGGALTIAPTTSDVRYITSAALGAQANIIMRLKTAHFNSASYIEGAGFYGYGYLMAYPCDETNPGKYAAYDATSYSTAAISDWSADTYYTVSILRVSGAATFLKNGATVATLTSNLPGGSLGVNVMAKNNLASVTVDYIYAWSTTTNPPLDGTWGIVGSDIYQTTPFSIVKIDPLGLFLGPCEGIAVMVYDVNNALVDNGDTGTDGSVTFQLYRNQYYRITFIDLTQGVNKTWTGYPSSSEYTIYVWPWELQWTPGKAGPDSEYKDVKTFIAAQLNATDANDGDITVYYNDTGEHTTTTTINIYKRNNMTNETLIASYTNTTNNFSRLFTIDDAAGDDYKVTITATNTYFGTITRAYSWTFPGIRYNIVGLPAMAYVWIGFLIPVFVALTVSQRNLKFGPIVFCAMSWGFNTLGWMSQLGELYTIGLAVATFFSVLLIFSIKAKEGGY